MHLPRHTRGVHLYSDLPTGASTASLSFIFARPNLPLLSFVPVGTYARIQTGKKGDKRGEWSSGEKKACTRDALQCSDRSDGRTNAGKPLAVHSRDRTSSHVINDSICSGGETNSFSGLA